MAEYNINKENKFATYRNKKASFVVERTSNEGTELFSFSSLKTVRSEQTIDSSDRRTMNDSRCVNVSTSFKNISSYYTSSNTHAIPFNPLQPVFGTTPVVPKIYCADDSNKAASPKFEFKIKPIKPIPILDLRKRRVEANTPILDLRKRRIETSTSVLDLKKESNETKLKIADFSRKEVKMVKSNLDLSKDSANECQILDLSKKRAEITKTVLTLTNKPSKVIPQNLDLMEKEPETIEPELDLKIAPIDFSVPTFKSDEGVNPIPEENIVTLSAQNIEIKDEEALPELDYYPETPDSPVPTLHIDERVGPISKENADLNYQDLESDDPPEEELPELDYYPETGTDSDVPTLPIDVKVSPISKNIPDFQFQATEVNDEALPKLDAKKSKLDFPVSILLSDETVNPSSKEEIGSLNTSDIEFKVGEGAYEISPELDTTEAPVDFPVPRLHSDENISITEEKIEFLKSEGVVIRNGEWSVEEEDLLRRNYRDFLNQYRIHDCRLLFRRHLKAYLRANKFLKAKHFYVRLGKDINERTLKSIFHKARSMFYFS